MWDLPGPGIEPMSPELAGRFLTTAPPGKSHKFSFLLINFYWSIVDLQCYVSFCCTAKWIRFGFFLHLYWSVIAIQCCVSFCCISESAICIHISSYALPLEPPSHPPYPTPLGGRKAPSWFPVLCSCFPLAIYFSFGSVYMQSDI